VRASVQTGASPSFDRFAGLAAMAVGLGGVAYAIAFVTLLRNATKAAAVFSSLLLLVGGLLASAVLVAVYERVRPTDPAFAMWALVIGFAGTIGSALHGGYDLALLAHKVTGAAGIAANPTDPRGLATFGFTAVALAVMSWLILRGAGFDRRLGYLGLVASLLLLVIYVGRLTLFNPKNAFLLPVALLSGFIVNPAFYVWLGLELRKGSRGYQDVSDEAGDQAEALPLVVDRSLDRNR
jgi:hypothetical protein